MTVLGLMDLNLLLKRIAFAEIQQRLPYGCLCLPFKLDITKYFREILIFIMKPWAGKHVHIREVSFGASRSFAIGFYEGKPWFSAGFQSDVNMQVRRVRGRDKERNAGFKKRVWQLGA